MGCCLSRSASPYPDSAPNASARHINPPPQTLPESIQSGHTGAQASPRRRRRNQGPLDEHINKPLRRHHWTASDRRWTRAQLDNERAEFFDTRVTGRHEIWQTIRAALDVLQDVGDGTSDGLDTAQSILMAAEISLPTGDLSDGVYDSLGNYYQLPQWVVSDPSNITMAYEPDELPDTSTGEEDMAENGEIRRSDMSMDNTEIRRIEKGKGILDSRDQVTLRARLSETGHDFDVTVSKAETVRSVIKKLADEASISPGKKIRIAYMGKLLKESQSLEAQGWQPGHIVNALVFDK